LRDLFTDRRFEIHNGTIQLHQIFAELPIAVLVAGVDSGRHDASGRTQT
jgi:hypothetical protein